MEKISVVLLLITLEIITVYATVAMSHVSTIPELNQDYCDPRHCNSYFYVVCGFNRKKSRFQWFNSLCHLMLNNYCANYRGFLRYDIVENKFCSHYVMDLRKTCPSACDDNYSPICGQSLVDQHVVLFQNPCALEAANCRDGYFEEYEEVNMSICKASFLGDIEFKKK